MRFPYWLVIELPNRANIRHLWRSLMLVAPFVGILVGAAFEISLILRERSVPAVEQGMLRIESIPPGATVVIDGDARGETPLSLPVNVGQHQLELRLTGYLQQAQSLRINPGQALTISSSLWDYTPDVVALRPALPGATIADARFLNDGRVALAVAVPPDGVRQAWVLNRTGQPSQIGPSPSFPGLELSPDATAVGFLAAKGPTMTAGFATPSPFTQLQVLRLGEHDPTTWFALPPSAKNDRLSALSWSPDGQSIIVVDTQQPQWGATQSNLFWVSAPKDAHAPGEGRLLVTIPSEILPDSFIWSPLGDQVAFLSSTGNTTSLCRIRVDGSAFQYLADVSRENSTTVAVATVAWSPDNRGFAYSALRDGSTTAGNWFFNSAPSRGLYVDRGTVGPSQPVEALDAQAPVWWDDTSIAVLTQLRQNGPLTLEQVDSAGVIHLLGTIPLSPRGTISARWDVNHAQAIIAFPTTSGFGASPREYWLVRWRPEAGR